MEKISENLKNYKKTELVEMLEVRGIKGISKLDKEGLINKLVEFTLDEKNAWNYILFLTGIEYDYLVKLYKNGSISLKNIPDYNNVKGLLQTGYCYLDEDKLKLVDEAKATLKPLVTLKKQENHAKIHWIIECLDCANVLYGKYSLNNALALVHQDPNCKDMILEELENIVKALPKNVIGFSYNEKDRVFVSGYYDSDTLSKILERQGNKSYKIIVPQYINTLYSYDVIINDKYLALANKLNELLNNQDKASEITVELNRTALFGQDYNAYLKKTIEELNSLSADVINEIIALMSECYNSTPTVLNRGAAPQELFNPSNNNITRTVNKQKTFVNTNKIGRNDPCPCGSGKKYKKCCGLKSN